MELAKLQDFNEWLNSFLFHLHDYMCGGWSLVRFAQVWIHSWKGNVNALCQRVVLCTAVWLFSDLYGRMLCNTYIKVKSYIITFSWVIILQYLNPQCRKVFFQIKFDWINFQAAFHWCCKRLCCVFTIHWMRIDKLFRNASTDSVNYCWL